MGQEELIHEWNSPTDFRPETRITFQDETLRDGIQNPSVVDPTLADKFQLVTFMEQLGIHHVTVGLPGAGVRAAEDCAALIRHIQRNGFKILPACAARTIEADIKPIVEISQKAGITLEVMAFIGSSPIRQYVEGWDISWIEKQTVDAIRFAVREGLRITYVTEDSVRSTPEVLTRLFTSAIECGAHRLCLCDTVGYATPTGTRNLLQFTRNLIQNLGSHTGIDWHGHNDRGLALINALTAIESGADRIHGTALGIGERVGNTPMDLLLMNLRLAGTISNDLSGLVNYARAAARACHVPVPASYPLVGDDAFRTATGVHAAAVIKALRKGEEWLADIIYSGVPAGLFGRTQTIEIGPMSGASNVNYWLVQNGYGADEELVSTLLDMAKRSNRVLMDEEVLGAVQEHQRNNGYRSRV